MKFSEFIKSPKVIGTIFMGIFYALVMLAIFLPGYKAMPGNIDKLHVAIVNEDNGKYGNQIATKLEKQLPFEEVKKDLSLSKANKQLEDSKIALIINIPEDFSKRLTEGKVAPLLKFKINDAVPAMVSSSMDSVAKQINSSLEKQFSNQTAEAILAKFKVPQDKTQILANKIENAYHGEITHINKIPVGMNNGMLPMFLTMVAYTGAMIGAMQLVSALKENRHKENKYKLFLYIQSVALITAILSSLVAMNVIYLINDIDSSHFFALLGQSILTYFVCFNFTAVAIFLFGEGGMLINLALLLTQTLASGATMTQNMMPGLYKAVSHISPMYYSTQSYFINLYGSVSQSPYIVGLIIIGIITLAINLVLVMMMRDKAQLPVKEEQLLVA